MRLFFSVAGMAVFLWAAVPVPAAAQPVCGARQAIADHLKTTYDETPVGIGLTLAGGVIEVYAAAENGTWTMVQTHPNGMACLVAVGRDWENLAPAVTPPEERKI